MINSLSRSEWIMALSYCGSPLLSGGNHVFLVNIEVFRLKRVISLHKICHDIV